MNTFPTGLLTLLLFYVPVSDLSGREVLPLTDSWEFIKTDFEKDFNDPSHCWEKVPIHHTWNHTDTQSGEGFYQ